MMTNEELDNFIYDRLSIIYSTYSDVNELVRDLYNFKEELSEMDKDYAGISIKTANLVYEVELLIEEKTGKKIPELFDIEKVKDREKSIDEILE